MCAFAETPCYVRSGGTASSARGSGRLHAGILSSVYLIHSMLECADRELVCNQTGEKVCNLEQSARTIVLVLSILTNAASLGYQAARNALHWRLCCLRHAAAAKKDVRALPLTRPPTAPTAGLILAVVQRPSCCE